jgi:hypothetical protein
VSLWIMQITNLFQEMRILLLMKLMY